MQQSGFYKFSTYTLLILTLLTFLTPLWVSKEFLFPFITSKAFYLRILVELGLPFFVYMLIVEPSVRPSYKNPLHISVFAFWIINIFSALFGIDPIKALWGNFERMGGVFYLTHLILLYFYIVVLGNAKFSFLKTIVYSNIGIAVALSLYGIAERLGMQPWVPDPSVPRISATFGNPIFFPSYLIPIMFLTLFWALRKTGLIRYLFFFWAFLQLVGIALSGTRGAVVGLIIGGFVAAVAGIAFNPNNKIRFRGLAVVGVILALGIGLYLNSDKLPEGSMVRRVFQLRDNSTTARLIQWRVALSGFKDYPILGTGAENYYVTGNKYFNPEIYPYDSSWFDKPHNYLLEVLVTNGVLGITAYLAMLVFAVWAFYKSWRLGALSLSTCAILLAGLLVYEIQNLFVFDTVSASMSFYIYMAFASFLWEKILRPEAQKQKKQKNMKLQPMGAWGLVGFTVFLPISMFGIWAGNALPLLAARNTNYGYAYSGIDAKIAQNYFEKALSEKYNFDLSETANKYQEFALILLRNPGKNSQDFVDSVYQDSVDALERVFAQNPNNPINWEKLAGAYLNYAYYKQVPPDSKIDDVIDKAIKLAPKRTEAISLEVQLEMFRGNVKHALALSREIVELNPGNLDNQWQMSIVLKENGQDEEAIKISEMLLDKKYDFPSLAALNWLADYYITQKNWPRAIQVVEKMVKIDPNNKDVYVALADVYFRAGQKEKAADLAQRLLQLDQTLKPKVQKFLPQGVNAPSK